MAYYSFEDLNCWKAARTFRNYCFEMVKSFPQEEKYRLADQLIRSSRGIGNAIAEGHGRFHHKENIQFCRIGRGSMQESIDHLITAKDCNYISDDEYEKMRQLAEKILATLNGYIAHLKKQT